MKPLFCPKCHRRIEIPKFLLNANIKAENGITLQCGFKPCKGKVKYKPKPVTDDISV